MSAYEDARGMSGGVKPKYGDSSHISDLFNAIGEMQVPASDSKAYKMATTAGDSLSKAAFAHNSGGSANASAASQHIHEAAKTITDLANHLINTHGVTEARAKYAGDVTRQHALDYTDGVVQDITDAAHNREGEWS